MHNSCLADPTPLPLLLLYSSAPRDPGVPRNSGPGARSCRQSILPCWGHPEPQDHLAEEWHGPPASGLQAALPHWYVRPLPFLWASLPPDCLMMYQPEAGGAGGGGGGGGSMVMGVGVFILGSLSDSDWVRLGLYVSDHRGMCLKHCVSPITMCPIKENINDCRSFFALRFYWLQTSRVWEHTDEVALMRMHRQTLWWNVLLTTAQTFVGEFYISKPSRSCYSSD